MRELKEEFAVLGIALSGYGMENDIQQARMPRASCTGTPVTRENPE